ncbi:F-box protein At3g07870-like [Vicia villosa]|uniref:F-box protein At3g07870-like n=1 Tax=Vicia villosa TaxID=3911 RepID=UPI00273BED5E|nr:F-box protein At3g07870-like [Vicia villosa]
MKKRTNGSIAVIRASQRGSEAKESYEPYSYFFNLPYNVIVHIFLQLSIKTLLICKCVCKDWKTMISEPYFSKLQFEWAQNCFMVRTLDYKRVSRTLHLLECEPEKFEIGSNSQAKLEPIFKLPLRDAKSFKEREYSNKSKRPIRLARLLALEKKKENAKRGKQSLYIASNKDHDKFNIVNSCNGLLCLCEPTTRNPLVICNPVTGEFIRLPKASAKILVRMQVKSGLGFHPKTSEYKVVKIWIKHVKQGNVWVFDRAILEINTLGTPSWRNVEVDSQFSISKLKDPTYVNGALHWIMLEGSILCFCCESERLQSFPSPTGVFGNHSNGYVAHKHIRMGELKGFLYVCDVTNFSNITMWVMNKYGIGESWTKVYSIDTFVTSMRQPVLLRNGYCWPIKQFDQGVAIFLHHYGNSFIYYEPKKYGFKVFGIHGTSSPFFEVIPHIPSLISLTDLVKGENIEVLNIYSRCAKFKLREENEVFSLAQEIV